MEKSWNEDMEQSKKRKREWRSSSSSSSAAAAAAGGAIQNIYSQHQQQQQQPQQDVILQPQRSQWIDLTTSQIPLPPGWEQCLDLQTGEMYFVNWATQTKTLQDPRKPQIVNNYMEQNYTSSNNNNQESIYGIMMQPNVGYHQPPHSSSLIANESIARLQNPMDMPPNSNMTTTICLHCYTFVMIPQSSPQCPNCKNACNIGLNSTPLIK